MASAARSAARSSYLRPARGPVDRAHYLEGMSALLGETVCGEVAETLCESPRAGAARSWQLATSRQKERSRRHVPSSAYFAQAVRTGETALLGPGVVDPDGMAIPEDDCYYPDHHRVDVDDQLPDCNPWQRPFIATHTVGGREEGMLFKLGECGMELHRCASRYPCGRGGTLPQPTRSISFPACLANGRSCARIGCAALMDRCLATC